MLSKVHPVSVKVNFILNMIHPFTNCFQGILTKRLILTDEQFIPDQAELKILILEKIRLLFE
jgi:hypothetical protein